MKLPLLMKRLNFDSITQSFGGSSLPRLSDAVRDCSTLEKIRWDVDIGSQRGIVNELNQISTMTRRCRPIDLSIQLDQNPDGVQTRKRLLDSHPETRLELFGWRNDLKLCRENCKGFEHIYEFNRHGRYLLDRLDFPIFIWPIVLEKANTKESTLYEFLKGPSLADRQNFGHDNSEQSKAKQPRIG